MGVYLLVLLIVSIVSASHRNNKTARYSYPKKYAVNEFQTTYSAAGTVYNIYGYAPATVDPIGYPLHVFIQGTHSDPDSSWSLTVQSMTQYMAERGFISASIFYNNPQYPLSCNVGTNSFYFKANSMFNITNTQSAFDVLCNGTPELNINCDRGIVGHGISQGAQLISLAGYFAGDTMISGVNPLAGGTAFVGSCINYENIGFDQSKIRSRVGVNDGVFCDDNASCRNAQTATTGYACPNQVQCMQDNGSGWYIIQTDETASGSAAHCYMFLDSECQDAFDTNYYPDCPDCDWSMQADLGWLISRVYPQ